ncbi:trypsin-like [Teleopsis dalmanni]|uniref:trypsin-like n=1 Tax=Teleopsis dalmanni TaxID=139649 RepID=UPI0018CF053D|nr:trypsin-like [Teleopsis dalmanni]
MNLSCSVTWTTSSHLEKSSASITIDFDSSNSNLNTTRDNIIVTWINQIFNPSSTTTTTTTTTTSAPQRSCAECNCGTINKIHRIVGGQETVTHQYPWMAMLLSRGSFYCGGTLINDQYVLTAAHCVKGFRKTLITIRLLEHNRRNSSVHKIDRNVDKIFIHPDYSTRTFDSDIALIRMSEPVEVNDLLRPVCMPDPDKSFAGENAVATGWGALSQGGSVSQTLQEVEVPIISQEACRGSKYGPSITDNMLCAGYDEGGKDACQGDSGGPLHVIVNNTKEHQLAGITSWGEGCAKPNTPGVYTRVNNFNTWIANRTRDACTCHPVKKCVNRNSNSSKGNAKALCI